MFLISYLFQAIPFLVMFAAGLLVPLLLWGSYYKFACGVLLVLFIWIMEVLVMGFGSINLGISLFPTDLILLLIGGVAALRLVFARDFPRRDRAWMVFCFAICFSLLLGLASFGTTAGVQVRPYFYFMVVGLYAMSFPIDEKRVCFLLNALAYCAFALVLLSVYRWVVYYTPIYELLPEGGVYNVDGPSRVVYSAGALVIAQILVAGLFFSAASPGLRWAQVLAPLLFVSVVVLQHRSVWLAAIVGILARFAIGRSQKGSALPQLFVAGLMFAVAVVPLAFSSKFSGIGSEVASSAARGLSGQGTVGERASSWREMIKKVVASGPKAVLVGQSFGSDSSRFVEDEKGRSRKISYQAHNMYVQTFFNTGLLGLCAFLAASFYVVSGLYRLAREREDAVLPKALLVIVLMQLAYYVPYGVDYIQALVFGTALAYVAGRGRQPEASSYLAQTNGAAA